MAVSKQAHSETIKIFYCENVFLIVADSYSTDTLLRWIQVRRKLQLEGTKTLDVKVSANFETPNWPNLMIWLERVYRGELGAAMRSPGKVLFAGPRYPDRMALGGLFDIVTELRDLPWERVKKLLLGHRPILVHADARWAQD